MVILTLYLRKHSKLDVTMEPMQSYYDSTKRVGDT